MGLGTGRERVGAFDEPPEREEGGAGEDGGAPGVGVPAAVLPHGEPPLVPQRRRVGDRGLRGVRVSSAPGVSSAAAGARDFPRPPDPKPTLEIRSRTDQTQVVKFRSDGSDPEIPVRLIFL